MDRVEWSGVSVTMRSGQMDRQTQHQAGWQLTKMLTKKLSDKDKDVDKDEHKRPAGLYRVFFLTGPP